MPTQERYGQKSNKNQKLIMQAFPFNFLQVGRELSFSSPFLGDLMQANVP